MLGSWVEGLILPHFLTYPCVKSTFVDIQIKPHDGFDLLKMVRADPAYDAVPLIALTASVMSSEVNRLREAGFDGAIAKPIDVTTFPDLLERILRGETIWHIT